MFFVVIVKKETSYLVLESGLYIVTFQKKNILKLLKVNQGIILKLNTNIFAFL